jgi:hypothetical protein
MSDIGRFLVYGTGAHTWLSVRISIRHVFSLVIGDTVTCTVPLDFVMTLHITFYDCLMCCVGDIPCDYWDHHEWRFTSYLRDLVTRACYVSPRHVDTSSNSAVYGLYKPSAGMGMCVMVNYVASRTYVWDYTWVVDYVHHTIMSPRYMTNFVSRGKGHHGGKGLDRGRSKGDASTYSAALPTLQIESV